MLMMYIENLTELLTQLDIIDRNAKINGLTTHDRNVQKNIDMSLRKFRNKKKWSAYKDIKRKKLEKETVTPKVLFSARAHVSPGER